MEIVLQSSIKTLQQMSSSDSHALQLQDHSFSKGVYIPPLKICFQNTILN